MPNNNTQISSMRFKYFERNNFIETDGNTNTSHGISVVIKNKGLKGCLQKGAVLISLY